MKLVEKANVGVVADESKGAKSGVGAAIERLEGNLSK